VILIARHEKRMTRLCTGSLKQHSF